MGGMGAIPLRGGNEYGVEVFSGSFTVGSAGAVTAGSFVGKGIATVVHTGTGDYTVTIDRPAVHVLDASANVSAKSDGSAGVTAQVYFADETANPLVFDIFVMSATNTLADPASGQKVRFTLILARSKVS